MFVTGKSRTKKGVCKEKELQEDGYSPEGVVIKISQKKFRKEPTQFSTVHTMINVKRLTQPRIHTGVYLGK